MGYPHPSHPRETVVLSRDFGDAKARGLAVAMKRGGYQGLEKALGMSRDQVIEDVKASGVRGRGGAGFSTARKWRAARAALARTRASRSAAAERRSESALPRTAFARSSAVRTTSLASTSVERAASAAAWIC